MTNLTLFAQIISLLPKEKIKKFIKDARTDNKATFDIEVNPFSIVVADRGYCDYTLLNHWDSNNVFFVVRHKDNICYTSLEELPLPEKHTQNVLIDKVIEFDNFTLAASTISALYKARWKIEIIFSQSQAVVAHQKFYRYI